MTTTNLTIQADLKAGTDYRFLELSPDAQAWPRHDERTRTLLVAFNVPGYYSLPVRVLSLTSALAGSIPERHDVRYIEIELGESWERLLDAVVHWAPSIIGFTVNIWNLETVLQFIAAVKRQLPDTTILLGGQEVTQSVTDFMHEHSTIDFIIEGEGEIPFLQFLTQWDAGERRLRDVAGVSGLRYRMNGSTASTGHAEIIADLDALPSPILAGLVPVRTKNKLGVMLEGARGCPYQCSFCFEGSRTIKVRMASIERLTAEAHFMVAQGATYFHLLDPILSNSRPDRLEGIARIFKELNATRKMQISLETYAQHLNDKIAPYLADFTTIDVGLQSINPDTLKEIRRVFTREKFLEGLASLRRANPNINIYLICGLPYETLLTFLEGISFVFAQRPVRIFINELCLLNGTELRRKREEYGYDFSPTPPYRVYASKWMNRWEMRLANVLSNYIYRRFNFSIQALFPLAPWAKHSGSGEEKKITLDLRPGNGGTVDRAALEAQIKNVSGADVEILGNEAVCSSDTFRLLGQLQLSGASRLKITAPLPAFADLAQVEKLIALGALHFKSYHAGGGKGTAAALQNLTRSFTMKGYAALKPVSELVVVRSATAPREYRSRLDEACRSSVDVVSVPLTGAPLDEAWIDELAACFRETVETGKWLKVPEAVADRALEGIRDKADVLRLLGQLDLLSAPDDARAAS